MAPVAFLRLAILAAGSLLFCVLLLLPLKSHAQSPPGDGWSACVLQPGTLGDVCVVVASDAEPVEIFIRVRYGLCSESLQVERQVMFAGGEVGPFRCIVSVEPFEDRADDEAAMWTRAVTLGPQPPASAASGALASEATVRELAGTAAALFWLLCAALGFGGYGIGARDA
jgi:hypothetical protein